MQKESTIERSKTKDKDDYAEVKAEIQMKNLKLYMKNQSIIEENEKLRK